MKYACVLMLAVAAATASVLPQLQQAALKDQVPVVQEKFLVELQPGKTRWITEEEKWALKRVRSSRSGLPVHADTTTHRKVITLWT